MYYFSITLPVSMKLDFIFSPALILNPCEPRCGSDLTLQHQHNLAPVHSLRLLLRSGMCYLAALDSTIQ